MRMLTEVRTDVARLREGLAPQLLLFLLLPVPALLLAHELHQRGSSLLASRRWDVDVDRGWIEVLGYVYVILAAFVLAGLAWRRHEGSVYGAWAFALSVLVLDDGLEGHELGGAWLARRFSLFDPPGLRTQDVGELLVWGAMGVVVLLVLWSGHRSSSARARSDSWWLVGLTCVLMIFAVGIDMFDIGIANVTSSSWVELLVTSVEAAGEVGAMAAVLVYVVHVARRRGHSASTTDDRVIDLRDRTPVHGSVPGRR